MTSEEREARRIHAAIARVRYELERSTGLHEMDAAQFPEDLFLEVSE